MKKRKSCRFSLGRRSHKETHNQSKKRKRKSCRFSLSCRFAIGILTTFLNTAWGFCFNVRWWGNSELEMYLYSCILAPNGVLVFLFIIYLCFILNHQMLYILFIFLLLLFIIYLCFILIFIGYTFYSYFYYFLKMNLFL